LRDARSFDITLVQKAFYFWTNLGSSAVMVFFVLSGFLVGGSVIKALRDERFTWRAYAITRGSRLYTVLVPAVVIGVAIDAFGSNWLGGASPYRVPHYGFMLPDSIAAALTLPIALGNLSFLQEIFVPTVGSNHPLWSLTNEAWYYAAFPFLATILLG